MPKLPVDSPIDFLVRRKFGRLEFEDPGPYARIEQVVAAEDHNKKVELYRAELAFKSDAEISVLVEQARNLMSLQQARTRDHEESMRWFNQPSAIADFDHWSKCSTWSLDEAVALSFGKEPETVNWTNVSSCLNISIFAKQYARRREIVFRAAQAGQLFDPVLPTLFLAWAKRMQIELPTQLESAVEQLGLQIRDWKSVCDEQSEIIQTQKETIENYKKTVEIQADALTSATAKVQQLQEQLTALNADTAIAITSLSASSADAKERTSMMKLILGMALSCYNFDPTSQKSTTPKAIESDLAHFGIVLSDDTARKYLKEAADSVNYALNNKPRR